MFGYEVLPVKTRRKKVKLGAYAYINGEMMRASTKDENIVDINDNLKGYFTRRAPEHVVNVRQATVLETFPEEIDIPHAPSNAVLEIQTLEGSLVYITSIVVPLAVI